MTRALKIFNWILCRSIAVLLLISVAFAGGYGPSKDANTVQGKAPAVASGLATLDGSSKLVQDANTVGGKAPAVANGLATLNASGALVQPAIPGFMTENSLSTFPVLTVPLTMGAMTGELNLGTVTNGDRYIAVVAVSCSKGATAGNVTLKIGKSSGSASLTQMAGFESCQNTVWGVASSAVSMETVCFGKILGTGSLWLTVYGESLGSTCILSGISMGSVYVNWIKKQ